MNFPVPFSSSRVNPRVFYWACCLYVTIRLSRHPLGQWLARWSHAGNKSNVTSLSWFQHGMTIWSWIMWIKNDESSCHDRISLKKHNSWIHSCKRTQCEWNSFLRHLFSHQGLRSSDSAGCFGFGVVRGWRFQLKCFPTPKKFNKAITSCCFSEIIYFFTIKLMEIKM